MGAIDNAYVFNGGPGGSIEQNRIAMETTSGMSCGASATSCTDAGGGGWYVQAFETASGKENHCFHYGNSPCGGTPMDAAFVSGSHYWSLEPSLDWLAGFATP